MERSLWILILIMRHRTKIRLLVITNVKELTGIKFFIGITMRPNIQQEWKSIMLQL